MRNKTLPREKVIFKAYSAEIALTICPNSIFTIISRFDPLVNSFIKKYTCHFILTLPVFRGIILTNNTITEIAKMIFCYVRHGDPTYNPENRAVLGNTSPLCDRLPTAYYK